VAAARSYTTPGLWLVEAWPENIFFEPSPICAPDIAPTTDSSILAPLAAVLKPVEKDWVSMNLVWA